MWRGRFFVDIELILASHPVRAAVAGAAALIFAYDNIHLGRCIEFAFKSFKILKFEHLNMLG